MAWDEWNQIKTDLAARQHDGTQLNSTAGGPGGAMGSRLELKSNAQGQQGAVKVLVEQVRPGVDRAGVRADESTDAAERAFRDWATGAGLTDAHEEWARQVKNLKGRLAQDQDALSRTKNNLQQVDHGVRSSLARIDVPD